MQIFQLLFLQVVRWIFRCARERAKKANYQDNLKTDSKQLWADEPRHCYSSPVISRFSLRPCPTLTKPDVTTRQGKKSHNQTLLPAKFVNHGARFSDLCVKSFPSEEIKNTSENTIAVKEDTQDNIYEEIPEDLVANNLQHSSSLLCQHTFPISHYPHSSYQLSHPQQSYQHSHSHCHGQHPSRSSHSTASQTCNQQTEQGDGIKLLSQGILLPQGILLSQGKLFSQGMLLF